MVSPAHKLTSQTARQVAAWKADVETFYRDEWSRLRDLIMELEEEAWEFQNGHGEAIVTGRVSGDTGSSPTPTAKNGTATSEPAESPDRLSDLMAQISQQLRTSSKKSRR